MTKSMDDWVKAMEADGPIAGVGGTAQMLKSVMRQGRNWEALPNEAKELLEQTATMLARILNGNAIDPSHWNGAAACLRLRALALAPRETNIETGMATLARGLRPVPPPGDGAA